MSTIDRTEYSERIKFEHELINRRLTWLLTSQSILFAAYAVALDASARPFLDTIAMSGALVAILVLVGIVAAYSAKYCTWQDFRDSGNPDEEFWVRTRITYIASIPEFALPIVFVIAWGYLLFVAN